VLALLATDARVFSLGHLLPLDDISAPVSQFKPPAATPESHWRYRDRHFAATYRHSPIHIGSRPGAQGHYFFLPAIGLAGPLRVRALVWVRWPRTGRPRRWRRPR